MKPKELWCFIDDKESETLIRSISWEEYHICAEIYPGDIQTAIHHIKAHHSPDILIVDISKSGMPISDIAALSDICEPGIEVIVVGEKNDVSIFRNLIKLGVRDYLVKPLPMDYLLKNLSTICGIDDKQTKAGAFQKSGRLIGVIGAVGGSGVSTIVSNLGFILSQNYHKHIAILDSDFQFGTISQFFDIEPSSGFPHLFDLPDRIDEVLIDRYMTFYRPNFGILSTQVGIQSSLKIRKDAIEGLLNILISHFHFTLVDLSRNFSNGINFHVFEKANLVFIVTDYSILGIKDTKRILDTLKTYPTLKHSIVVVANKVGQHQEGEISRQSFEEALKNPVSFEINFDKKKYLKSLNRRDSDYH
jgi:pilus assembly protein CpaE